MSVQNASASAPSKQASERARRQAEHPTDSKRTTRNKGPWLGGMLLEKKAGSLNMFLNTRFYDPTYLLQHKAGFAFDLGMDNTQSISIEGIQRQLAELLDMKSFSRKSMNEELKR